MSLDTLSFKTGRERMNLSAPRFSKGKSSRLKRDRQRLTSSATWDEGIVITSSIRVEAVDELKLKKGDAAYAVIKASDVIVGRD